MVANGELVYANGFYSRSPLELGGGQYHAGNLPAGLTVAAVPATIVGPANSGYALKYNVTDGSASFLHQLQIGQVSRKGARIDDVQSGHYMTSGCMSYLWYPATNSSGNLPILGPDNGSLNGYIPAWRSDQKIEITDYASTTLVGPTTATFSAASPDWYEFSLRWSEFGPREVELCIYKMNGGAWDFVERLYTETTGASITQYFRAFSVYGAASGAYWLTNIGIWGGGGVMPPRLPNFDCITVNNRSTNSTSWTDQAGSDTAANEYGAIDETPGAAADDTDYVKIATNDFFGVFDQYYTNTSGFGTGRNILGIGVVMRCITTTASRYFYPRIYNSTTGYVVGTALSLGSANNAAYASVFTSTRPGADPKSQWTETDVNTNNEYGHSYGRVNSGEGRVSQFLIYEIYGQDSIVPRRRAGGQVVGG